MSKQKKTALDLASLKRVMPYIRPYRLQVLLSLVCASVSAAAALLIPVFSGNAIDCMIGAGQVDFDGILFNAICIGVTIALAAVAQQVLATSNNRIAYCVSRDIRNEASAKRKR